MTASQEVLVLQECLSHDNGRARERFFAGTAFPLVTISIYKWETGERREEGVLD